MPPRHFIGKTTPMQYTDFLNEHGVRYWIHGDSHHVCEGWIGTDCPVCSPGSSRVRLGINLASGAMHCWSCGPVNRIEALKTLTGLSGKDCYAALQGMSMSAGVEKKQRGKLILPSGVGPLTKPHKEYLRGRGLDPKEIERVWAIQGTGKISSHPWRLYIPVTDDGEVVTWTTRSISQTVEKRYINARPEQEIINIKHCLYGEQHARHCAIIVEGPADAWRVGAGAVCTFGLSQTRSQMAKLARYPRRAICFDSSPDAQRRAGRLAGLLCTLDGSTMIVTLDAEDPGSASKREIRKLRGALGV